jgi:hypothetical protein
MLQKAEELNFSDIFLVGSKNSRCTLELFAKEETLCSSTSGKEYKLTNPGRDAHLLPPPVSPAHLVVVIVHGYRVGLTQTPAHQHLHPPQLQLSWGSQRDVVYLG